MLHTTPSFCGIDPGCFSLASRRHGTTHVRRGCTKTLPVPDDPPNRSTLGSSLGAIASCTNRTRSEEGSTSACADRHRYVHFMTLQTGDHFALQK